MKIEKVAVVMGGMSHEREVSLASGKGIAAALKKRNYVVQEIDLTKDIPSFIKQLNKFKPDIVFNALHGKFGEDGCLQGLLNMMHIPYTYSGVQASAIAMDKERTKQIAEKLGIPVAKGGLKTKAEMTKNPPKMPYVAKPNDDGSSVGVVIVKTLAQHKQLLKKWKKDTLLLVEEYIPGQEITVAVLDNKVLGSLELCPKTGFYDYKNKYTAGHTEHIVPASLPKKQQDLLGAYALKLHKALKCRGVTRCDFRYDDTNEAHPKLVFLEINTNPGMTALSLVPDIAKHKKIAYDELIDILVKEARCD